MPLLVFQRKQDGQHDDEDDDALHALCAKGDSDHDIDDDADDDFQVGGEEEGSGMSKEEQKEAQRQRKEDMER